MTVIDMMARWICRAKFKVDTQIVLIFSDLEFEYSITILHGDHLSFCDLKYKSGLILGLHPANKRRRYKVTPSLIGWAQTWNQPCRYTRGICILWNSGNVYAALLSTYDMEKVHIYYTTTNNTGKIFYETQQNCLIFRRITPCSNNGTHVSEYWMIKALGAFNYDASGCIEFISCCLVKGRSLVTHFDTQSQRLSYLSLGTD